MISVQLLISETYLRENTPLSQNIQASDILSSAYEASDMHVQPILGTTFYNQILASYSAQTLTADEIVLVSLIKPIVAYRAAEMALPFINFQIKNKGIQEQSGDNSSPAGQGVMSMLRNELKNRAEFYTTRLTQYLCKNSNLYAGYIDSTNNAVDLIPSKAITGYDSGFGSYGSPYYNKNGMKVYNAFFNPYS